jgi:PAS domain S-box-containing protein
MSILHNITERKRAEEALRNSEEKLRVMFESMNDGVIVSDSNIYIVDVNKAMLKLLGLRTKEELIGRSAVDVVKFKNQERTMTNLDRMIKERPPQERGMYCMLLPSGKEVDIEVITSAMYDDDGSPLGFMNVIRDITDQKKAEEEKHRMEERSRKVVEDIFRFIPEGVLVFSRKVELLRQNQTFRGLVSGYAKRLGFTEDELENLIMDKVKAGLRDNNIKEIRIARKHETGKQT